MLEFHILDTGYCTVSENHILLGGQNRKVNVHSLIGLFKHPKEGWLLFDTGYAPRMAQATSVWPYWLYGLVTPFSAPAELAAVRQLERLGLFAKDIRHIVISHFHADHFAGLLDFPLAQFICSQSAYQSVASLNGSAALRKAFIPSLLPADFSSRSTFVDNFAGEKLIGLGGTYDLFGDGSLRLVQLPGHARGQIGLLAQTKRGPVLCAADGAWYRRAIRERRPPSALAELIVDDKQAVRTTLDHLNKFAAAYPETIIVPTHCPEAYAEFCTPQEVR